jgi:hypothetical protein
MRFVLVGVPGTDKGKLTRALARSLGISACSGLTVSDEFALGALADYRAELGLATDRCFQIQSEPKNPTIFEHTLIDSLAYASLRYVMMRDYQNVDEYTQEKWASVAALAGAMLRDTFRYDHVFFISRTFEGDGDVEEEIQSALLSVLEGFGIPYTHLEGKYEENRDAIAQTIEAYLGSRSDSSEPSQS